MFHILDFIDSKDIREHNANTQFTPMEQAVLRACLETHLSIMKRFNSMLAMAI